MPAHSRTHPILRAEQGTIYHRASSEMVLCYPNNYRVAGASLGYQVVYNALNSRQGLSCQRAVLPDDAFELTWRGPLRSLEHGMPLGGFDVVLFSIAYELDLPHLAWMLEAGGMAPLAMDRSDKAAPVIVGGPLTQSNVLPLGPFVDVVVMGEAEEALEVLLDRLESGMPKPDFLKALSTEKGFWVPSIHGDAIPDVLVARGAHIPARGVWTSPDAEFRDMALLETSRGCPRYCKFCVVRAPASPMRSPELDRVVSALDEGIYRDAPRVGFVGAAVSDWPHIKGALQAAIDRGKGIGISSLRADRLDETFVGLLHQGGYRTLTVASDAASERLRRQIMKGLRPKHFLRTAELARAVGMKQMKLYLMIGYPDERPEDYQELYELCETISSRIPLVVTISPFVPKLHTPLAEAPFEQIASQMRKLKAIQKRLRRRVEVRFDSPRWAWIEYRLSQGGMATGMAAWEAFRRGGQFSAYKRAFRALDSDQESEERAAVQAAMKHNLWALSGAR
ncbi:MAG TPA: radical SAM protein [Myxococcales bacterium]|nr:radical SAM protein [Myxococcales bacterium]HAN30368.1 radical SAM protein [Myxococcales bacterium]